jgi:hypothetical protein
VAVDSASAEISNQLDQLEKLDGLEPYSISPLLSIRAFVAFYSSFSARVQEELISAEH